MKIMELMGLLAVFAFIAVIDMPKLKATANKQKYLAVYFSLLGVGILLGILEIFQVIPDFYKSLVPFFQKISKAK